MGSEQKPTVILSKVNEKSNPVSRKFSHAGNVRWCFLYVIWFMTAKHRFNHFKLYFVASICNEVPSQWNMSNLFKALKRIFLIEGTLLWTEDNKVKIRNISQFISYKKKLFVWSSKQLSGYKSVRSLINSTCLGNNTNCEKPRMTQYITFLLVLVIRPQHVGAELPLLYFSPQGMTAMLEQSHQPVRADGGQAGALP